MIQKAKQILAGIDTKLVYSGKIPQVVWIFRAKNFYGLKDQPDTPVEAQKSLSDGDISTIAQRYLEAAGETLPDNLHQKDGELVEVVDAEIV